MERTKADLQYYIAAKAGILIVTFMGKINCDDDQVGQFMQELLVHKEMKFCVLYFRDVNEIDPAANQALTGMQSQLRDRFQSNLRLCSLAPLIRNRLLRDGVIKAAELTNNLREAVLELAKKEGR